MNQKELKSLLTYNQETGVFNWLPRCLESFPCKRAGRSWNSKYAGKAAGSNRHGYVAIKINGKDVYAHRLAWLYVHGEMPNVIDHVDGNESNNAISNIRNVTSSLNSKNRKSPSNNSSGFVGVSFNKGSGKYVAYTSKNRKIVYLGLFCKLSDAVKARVDSDELNEFHVNHGR